MSPEGLVAGFGVRLADGPDGPAIFVDVEVGAGVVIHDPADLVAQLLAELVGHTGKLVASVRQLGPAVVVA